MAISIGNRGWLELQATGVGPHRKVKIVSFNKNNTGAYTHPQFEPEMQPIAVINVRDGTLQTARFTDTGTDRGELKAIDTGTNDKFIGDTGDTLWVIYTDTGV